MTVVNLNYNPIKLAYNLIKLLKEKYKRDFKWNGYGDKFFVDSLWEAMDLEKQLMQNLSLQNFMQLLQMLKKNTQK